MKLKPVKNSGLIGIQTLDLCDTGTVLYQLSYEANWSLVTFLFGISDFFLAMNTLLLIVFLFSKLQLCPHEIFLLYVFNFLYYCSVSLAPNRIISYQDRVTSA